MLAPRTALAAVCLLGVAACDGASPQSAPLAPLGRLQARAARVTSPATVPLTIANLSGVKRAYFYIVGLGSDGNTYHVNAKGEAIAVKQSDAHDGYADYSVPVPASGTFTLPLPQLSAARMYVSLGKGLKVSISSQNVPSSPPGWVPSDPNYDTAFDWIEFTFNSSGWNGNTTAVDMYGLPLQIQLTGSSGVQTVGTPPGGRSAIFSGIARQPPFDALVITGPGRAGPLHDLRVISPFHGIENGIFDANYLAQYVASVWSAFANQPLTMNTSAWGVYTGTVTGTTLTFTQAGQAPIAFSEPTTHDVYANSGALQADPCGSPPSQQCLVQGQIADALSAALNRTTLPQYPTLPACTASEFYQSPPVNEYARLIHANAINGLAYAFGFDDSCDFSSFIADRAPTGVVVSIEPF
jgi:hypothetical protein